MALNLPSLPPLHPYPTGSEATQEAVVNWRELARLHTWHEELRQKEACANAMPEMMAALKPGLPVADVIALLTAVVDAIKRP